MPGFANDHDYLNMLDILAHSYGKLPSEIAQLDWKDIAICLAALRTRSQRLNKVIKQTTRKKTTVFPIINLSDFINGI